MRGPPFSHAFVKMVADTKSSGSDMAYAKKTEKMVNVDDLKNVECYRRATMPTSARIFQGPEGGGASVGEGCEGAQVNPPNPHSFFRCDCRRQQPIHQILD